MLTKNKINPPKLKNKTKNNESQKSYFFNFIKENTFVRQNNERWTNNEFDPNKKEKRKEGPLGMNKINYLRNIYTSIKTTYRPVVLTDCIVLYSRPFLEDRL